MEGNLIIVESPEKAKTIGGFLDKNQFIVKASIGHIRDLQEKKLSVDLDHGFAPEYVVPANKKKVLSELKKLSDKAAVVWLASDEDREGEAISWHLSETLGLDPDKTRRIAFHEITKTAVLDAIEHPRQIDMNLVNAQQARRVLDRIVGFELSPILWKKVTTGLSAGRVQSVAVRLIVEKEREIESFRASSSYRIFADFIGTNPGDASVLKCVVFAMSPRDSMPTTLPSLVTGSLLTCSAAMRRVASRTSSSGVTEYTRRVISSFTGVVSGS